jgi:hypothetical protein
MTPGFSHERSEAARRDAGLSWRARGARLLCSLALLAAPARPAEDPSPGPATIGSAAEVAGQWQPHQRLFVKGNLGVVRSQLDALERWLDAHATNWVVVLIESAAQETYTDSEGSRFTGIEAVNHALGKGLMNQTAFGESRDPRTQEPNAAIFVLALKDRRLSYFGSAAQDRRGLGEERWVGHLDQPAIAAMRDGGRVVDAVKDTISTINRGLDEAIQAEIETRERRQAEEQASRARAEEQARAEIQTATDALARLATRAGEFARRHPDATSDLARPELPKLQASLASAGQQLAAGNFSAARTSAGRLRAEVEAALRALDQHGADAARLERARARHQFLAQDSRAPIVKDRLDVAARALELATVEYRRADSRYLAHLGETEQALGLAEAGVAAAEREARIRRIAARAGTGYGLALLTIVGLVLNRRRANVKREAEEQCAAWDRALSEKSDALFRLLDRRGVVVGSSATEAARRYAGDTLKLAGQIIQDVDQLFIMSACAGRVLADARARLRPRHPLARLSTLVSRRPFQGALRLLREEPIPFRPDEGLDLVVRGARTERDRLLGRLEDYQPFRMTFTALIEAFDRQAERAVANLDRIESAVANVADHFRAIEARLPAAQADLEHFDRLAADGLLPLAEVRDGLLPAAAASLAEARALAAVDPVAAEAGPAERARQQAEDAAAIIALALRARTELLPTLRQAAATLAGNGVASPWMAAECERLSSAAESLAAAAREASQAGPIASLAASWDALVQRAARALELDDQRRGTATQAVTDARAALTAARERLGAELGLPAEKALCEPDANPDQYADRARKQLTSAHAALERGDVEGGAGALRAAAQLAAGIHEVIRASLDSFTAHPDALSRLRTESARLGGLLVSHRENLDDLRARYLPEALRLGAGDPTHPQANATVADNADEAEAHLARAREQTAAAEAAFREARLLAAAQLRESAAAELELAAHRLEELRERRLRLDAAERTNAEMLAEADARVAACEPVAAAPTTMASTGQLLAEVRERLTAVRPQVGAVGGNPLAVGEELATILRELDAVQDRARCDRDVFEEASRSVRAASVQLSEARLAAGLAAGDNVPDSAAFQSATASLPTLSAALTTLEARLREPHQDWNAVDAEADHIAREAGRLTAILRGELAQAQAALQAISAAARAVRQAGSWTGGFGVLILGSPGSDTLEGARVWLQRGNYERARSNAETARRMAEAAIAQAAAEMERRRLAELARLERERRRRAHEAAARAARAARRNSDGFGGFGGFGGGADGSGSGSSWGSSGSGFGSSGFGGGGSGFRTSGW